MMIFMITFYSERRSFMFNLVILNFHKRFPRVVQPLTVWCLWEIKSDSRWPPGTKQLVSVGGARTCRIAFPLSLYPYQ